MVRSIRKTVDCVVFLDFPPLPPLSSFPSDLHMAHEDRQEPGHRRGLWIHHRYGPSAQASIGRTKERCSAGSNTSHAVGTFYFSLPQATTGKLLIAISSGQLSSRRVGERRSSKARCIVALWENNKTWEAYLLLLASQFDATTKLFYCRLFSFFQLQ